MDNYCAQCDKKIHSNQKNKLAFRRCYNKHYNRAHGHCSQCWFKVILPASQTQHLTCKGCKKNKPLFNLPPPPVATKKKLPLQIIQIIDDDDDQVSNGK